MPNEPGECSRVVYNEVFLISRVLQRAGELRTPRQLWVSAASPAVPAAPDSGAAPRDRRPETPRAETVRAGAAWGNPHTELCQIKALTLQTRQLAFNTDFVS